MAHRTGPRRKLEVLEIFLEEYGPAVYHEALVATGDTVRADEVFDAVFTCAFHQYDRLIKVEDKSEWFRNLSASVSTEMFHTTIDERLRTTHADPVSDDMVASAVPQSQKQHTQQLLRALTAQAEAKERISPSQRLKWAVIVTVVLALTAVVYGANRPKTKQTMSMDSNHSVGALPSPLEDLPVKIVAQYRLPSEKIHLNRFTASSHSVFTSTWVNKKNGDSGIQLMSCPLTLTSEFFNAKMKPYAFIKVMSPSDNLETWTGRVRVVTSWNLWKWSCDVSGDWLVATVEWVSGGQQPRKVVQVYSLYLPTGEYSLSKSFETSPGIVDEYQVTVGAGRVVLQPALTNTPSSAYASTIGLPIQVFRLVGTNPETAISQFEQIPSTFGYGLNPTVTEDGIIFQGIEGQNSALTNSQVDSTWYFLNWDGEFTELNGPPIDGRPHWAIRSGSGERWWAETTPDNADASHQVLVLMSQLSTLSATTQSPALSLSGAVDDFAVNGRYVYWIQSSDKVDELVIGEVQ